MPSMSVISIIAGGRSFLKIDREKIPGTIIAVNDSAFNTRCDIIVSMDRLWTEYRWEELRTLKKPTWIRKSAAQNCKGSWDGLHIFQGNNTSWQITDTVEDLHGTNSGMCAFNLAYAMKPAKIFLFGFDMGRTIDGLAYWYKPYAWTSPAGSTPNKRYAEWATQWKDASRKCAAAGIKVFNVSIESALRTFPKLKPEDLANA